MVTHDPITIALVQNRLDHIALRMGWVMTRTSRSPIFNQSHDFSCYLTTGDGLLISQADGIPIHTGGGGFAVRAILDAFAGRIDADDVFLLNDPYVAGGNHLPDWVIARPVFAGSVLVAFACNRAHQSDIGGGAAGTYNAKATEIFHEGIRLPVLKLIEGGRVRDDLWRLLMINTRCPELLDGDLRAMLGATQVGATELEKIVHEFGPGETQDLFAQILDHADKLMRAAIARLPDGVYEAEEAYHNDCFVLTDVGFRVTITKAGDALKVDFTGTDAQIRGFKNSSLVNTYSAVYAAIASFFDSELPRNEGTFRSVEIVAPEGTLVNAISPAPLTMCTVFPAHEIMHMVWWALGQAAPRSALAGWGKNAFPVTAGSDARGATWVMYNWGGTSGAGACSERDGFNQIGPMVTLGGLAIPNAETYEQIYPVRIIRHEFRQDGCGAGQHRGGSGAVYEVEFETEAEYSFRGEGLHYPSGRGVEGGASGAPGELSLTASSGEVYEPFSYGVERLGPRVLRMLSPGGGGFGNALTRAPELVLRDVRDGLVSSERALLDYGTVIAADGKSIDETETASVRLERMAATSGFQKAKQGSNGRLR
jgi:N-methylhydantoinase B